MTDDNTHLPAQTMNTLQLNHTYLIKRNGSDSLNSIMVLLITDKAYHIRWNNDSTNAQTWETKENMYDTYRLVEDISDFVVDKPFLYNYEITHTDNSKIKYVQCHVCKGFGTVPAPNTTSGNKICPLCNGGKMIVGEISQE
jgi:hypothetical protein